MKNNENDLKFSSSFSLDFASNPDKNITEKIKNSSINLSQNKNFSASKTAKNKKNFIAENAQKRQNTPSMNFADSLDAKAKSAILTLLHEAIAAHEIYPEDVFVVPENARVKIQFALSQTGALASIIVQQSSGVAALDEAALKAVQAASPVKRAGALLKEKQTFSVDILFA